MRAPGTSLPQSQRVGPSLREARRRKTSRITGPHRSRRPFVHTPGAPQGPAIRASSALLDVSLATYRSTAFETRRARGPRAFVAAVNPAKGGESNPGPCGPSRCPHLGSVGAGIEPSTYGVTIHCSDPLSYPRWRFGQSLAPADERRTNSFAPGRHTEPTPLVTGRCAMLVFGCVLSFRSSVKLVRAVGIEPDISGATFRRSPVEPDPPSSLPGDARGKLFPGAPVPSCARESFRGRSHPRARHDVARIRGPRRARGDTSSRRTSSDEVLALRARSKRRWFQRVLARARAKRGRIPNQSG